MPDIKIALVVAAAENDVIGRQNTLPWRLSSDLKYFKETTLGKPIIMGRKTYESIGRPLPGRSSIVVTRNEAWRPAAPYESQVQVVATIDDAIACAKHVAQATNTDEVMVIGGAEIYRLALARADRIYLTRVHASINGDAFFTISDLRDWNQSIVRRVEVDENNEYAHSYIFLERVTKS